ncbi:MAG: copper amine oxidase N-terminal domain-containing protein [Clostridia bacterium]|nr:copper amine oxidase N-terminal domain-containing protein [Clostridia bacterium]
MNKKLITLFIAGAMLLPIGGALANETPGDNENTPAVIQQETHSAFVTFTGKITAVEEDMYKAETEDGEEFLINKNYLQLSITNEGDMTEIAAGDQVTIYVRENTPTVLSLPAQYSPTVIVKNTEAVSAVDVDKYIKSGENDFGDYVNQAESLAIHVNDDTPVIKLTKETFDGNLDGYDLIVVYEMTTRSLPAQTTPTRIIVLNKDAEDIPDVSDETEESIDLSKVTKIVAGDAEIPYETVAGAENMIPLRAVAEGLGFDVQWNDALKSITLNGPYSLRIGEDSYIKGRMAPITLGQAPVCVPVNGTGVTYVPAAFFTEVLEAEAVYADGVLTYEMSY